MLKNIGIIVAVIALSSCSTLQGNKSDTHKAMCEQLKNRMLMNGSTQNRRVAQAQRAEIGNLSQTYRKDGCE